MAMSEDHFCVRMRYFHVNQAGSCFQQSSPNLMDFLPHVRHSTYEHNRQHVAECEGIPQYLQPEGGLHHLAHYMFAAGCPSDSVEQFIGIVATVKWSATPPLHRGHDAT
jgi:hypothetical protein